MENEREMRTDKSSLNLPHATQHLVMTEASSQLPAQDKHSPMWQKDGTTSSFSRPTLTSAISLASIGLACSVQRLHLKLVSGFRRPDMHCIPCGSNWNNCHIKWNLCQRPWDTRYKGLCQTSEAHRAPARYQDLGFAYVNPKSLSFHFGLPEDQL